MGDGLLVLIGHMIPRTQGLENIVRRESSRSGIITVAVSF